jgi:tetratricopeptide (TPR) repeat protein
MAITPGNLEAEKARGWVLAGRHQFAEALDVARTLHRRLPHDVQVQALLTDAHVELGQYREAEAAAQAMLDTHPGAVAALTRASYLREIFGDVEGARDLMERAYRQTPPGDVADRAWILTHIAHLHVTESRIDDAAPLLARALELFPDYHYALAGLAQVRAMQGRHAEAIDLLRRRYQLAPHPENLFDVAVALTRAGRREEAASAFVDFEPDARIEMDGPDNANRELIFYYADHANRPADALRVAMLESRRRQDVHTLHALAWALHVAGDHDGARAAIDRALAPGIRDARMLYHAGVIAARQKDIRTSRDYLERSLDASPRSEDADAARRLLLGLTAVRP